MGYDSLDRLLSIDNAGTPGGVPQLILNYTYDANHSVTSVSDQTGVTVAYAHDPRDAVSSVAWSGGEVDGVRLHLNGGN